MDYSKLSKQELIEIIKSNNNSEYNKSRDIFISNISHDVRTLLNAIYGHAQILKNTSLDDTQKDSVKRILDSSSHMIDLINEIIDISKNVGNKKLSLVRFNLNEFLKNIYHIFEQSTKDKKLTFNLDINIKEDFFIKTDKNKLFYILLNILGNAIKFTKEGKIQFICKKDEEKIYFEIKDSGIGIQKSMQEKVFENYTQTSEGRSFQGTGLGLAIAKENVEILGGELFLESKLGEGSRFYFSIKCESCKKEFLSTQKDIFEFQEIDRLKDGEEFFVLVVAKNLDNESIISNYFNSKRILFTVLKDEGSIIEYYSKYGVDMIFLDTSFSRNFSLDLVRKIKRIKKIPIIAISSSVMSDDLQKLQEEYTNYIISPFSFLDLDQALIFFSNKEFIYKKEESLDQNINLNIEFELKKDILDSANLGHYDSLKEVILKIKDISSRDVLLEYLNNYDFDTIISEVEAI